MYQEEEDFFKVLLNYSVELLHNGLYQFTDVTNCPCRVVSYCLHYDYSPEYNIKDFFLSEARKKTTTS